MAARNRRCPLTGAEVLVWLDSLGEKKVGCASHGFRYFFAIILLLDFLCGKAGAFRCYLTRQPRRLYEVGPILLSQVSTLQSMQTMKYLPYTRRGSSADPTSPPSTTASRATKGFAGSNSLLLLTRFRVCTDRNRWVEEKLLLQRLRKWQQMCETSRWSNKCTCACAPLAALPRKYDDIDHGISSNDDNYDRRNAESTTDDWETIPHPSDSDDEYEYAPENDGRGLVSSNQEIDLALSDSDCDADTDLVLKEEYEQWKNALEYCLAALHKKETSLRAELQKAECMEETVHRAQLITSHMYLFLPGVRTVTVQDWAQCESNNKSDDNNHDSTAVPVQLTLNDAYDSAAAEADALFQQARKLKRGSKIVRAMLDEIEQSKEILAEIQMDLEAAVALPSAPLETGTTTFLNENVLRLVQDRLMRTSEQTGFQVPSSVRSQKEQQQKGNQNSVSRAKKRQPPIGTPASNVRKFISPGGCTVLVGRNRRGNEYLTFQIARGEDVWMQ